MHVKKFEAKTLKDALLLIKQELGPDAIILSTKHNKTGLGLLNKSSVEVTAAVSEENLALRKKATHVLPNTEREIFDNLSVRKQKEILHKNDSRPIEKFREQVLEPAEFSKNNSNATQLNALSYPKIANLNANVGKLDEMGFKNSQEQNPQIFLKNKTKYIDIDDQQVAVSEGSRTFVEKPDLNAISTQMKNNMSTDVGKKISEVYEELQSVKKINNNLIQSKNKNLDSLIQYLKIKGFHHDFIQMYVEHLIEKGNEITPENLSKIKNDLYQFVQKKIFISAPIQDVVRNDGPIVHFFVGENGSGKTTSAAKIAAILKVKFGYKVGLITNDTTKIGGVEQMASISRILDLPFGVARTLEDLMRQTKLFQELDIVLVDTAGIFQTGKDYISSLVEFKKFLPRSKVHLVASISTEFNELVNQSRILKGLEIDDVIFTKLDAVSTYGTLLNFGLMTKIPTSYLTNGVEIPQKIERASADKILKYLFSKT